MLKAIIHHKPTRLFLILGGFFIANAIIAEFIGVKIFSLGSHLWMETRGDQPYLAINTHSTSPAGYCYGRSFL